MNSASNHGGVSPSRSDSADPVASLRDSAGLFGSFVARRSGWFGFVTGMYSRSHRNLEVWRYRRSAPESDARQRCALCGAGSPALRRLVPLGTSGDLAALGPHGVVLCTDCGVARTTPVPGDAALVISPDVAAPRLGLLQRALLQRFVRQRVRRVRPLLPGDRRPRVIDVGGGACAFANALAATGCDVTVFEPNAANSTHAGPGVRFIAQPFDDAGTTGSDLADGCADAVTMWHSLEHVPDPNATLRLAKRLLRPGGTIHVCVPNLDSLQSDLSAERWCYLDIPHHVTHFSPEGLARTLHRTGFGQVTAHWWNEEYEVFGFYQSMLNALTRSHNFFYNQAKKGRASDAGPVPLWTRTLTAAGPLLLPMALLYSWWGAAMAKPACVELSAAAER